MCSSHTAQIAGGGKHDDPHFKTWRGHHYDYNGSDLISYRTEFESGLGNGCIRTRYDVTFRTFPAP
jgi:hypothetical protein